MLSFYVKSLFTNVPLDQTINIILKWIYDDSELRISISRNEMKEVLLFCTKKVHFTFNGNIYLELEKAILPELTECITYWKRHFDDTIFFVELGTIN